MSRIRAEQQDGFYDVLRNWLHNQPWFPRVQGRWKLHRAGGMRLPTPEGDRDAQLTLELHLFDVEHQDGRERISVPVALRSRPSAHVGKNVLIGKLGGDRDQEIWIYDGTRDRAFLAAWLELARREQGTRNGRIHGRAWAGFAEREPFTTWLTRSAVDDGDQFSSRTLVAPPGVDAQAHASQKVLVDFSRILTHERPEAVETALTLSSSGGSSISPVLGAVTVADPIRGVSDLALIREGSVEAHSALKVLRSQLRIAPDQRRGEVRSPAPQETSSAETSDEDATAGVAEEHLVDEKAVETLHQLGESLARFHYDLATSFGAHPQTNDQIRETAAALSTDLQNTWDAARPAFTDEDATRLDGVISEMAQHIDDVDRALVLQRIHGSLTLEHFHEQGAPGQWIIDERDGVVDHAPALRDVVSVMLSLAHVVSTVDGSDAGARFTTLCSSFLEGYRHAGLAEDVPQGVMFRAVLLKRALETYPGYGREWIFRFTETD